MVIWLLCCVVVFGLSLRGPCAADDSIQPGGMIDSYFARYWAKLGVRPKTTTTDAEFLRRVTLDVAGRIPTAAEARQFLNDKNPSKRQLAIERLVESPEAARHLANVLRRMWLPQTDVPPHDHLGDELEQWLTAELVRRRPYDKLVQAVLSASGGVDGDMRGNSEHPAPATFVTANDARPEELAANVTREFLGANLECAQCHDHPFASWTQSDFWQTAAFFVPSDDGQELPSVMIPERNEAVTARLWTGQKLDWPVSRDRLTGRRVFARWAASSQNEYFARNAVNRLWAYYVGTPLHEPIDDLSAWRNSPHAELLDKVARDFCEHDFDLQGLIKAIVASRVYQLGATLQADEIGDQQQPHFSVGRVRELTGEQLYDSIRVATGRPTLRSDLDASNLLIERAQFVDKFTATNAADARRSVVQSLQLMNGPIVAKLVSPADCPLVTVAVESPFLNDRSRVELLYISMLSRMPADEESAPLQQVLSTAISTDDLRVSVSDICWAMINSVEFNTNH
jgi:hypothetical protein